MTSVVTMLNKTLAVEFYRLNSGFFLLIVTLTFGFMSGVEHKALAQFFVSSPHVLLIPLGVWIVYTFKILNFNNRQASLQENRILVNISFLPAREQVMGAGLCFALQFLPAIVYGVFLCGIARTMDAYQSISIIFGSLTGCCAVSIIIMMRIFRNPYHEKKVSFIKRFTDRYYQKPVIQFYTEWLLRQEPLMVGGAKIFSGLLLFGVCTLYASDSFDWRFISMAITGCGIANLLVIFQLQDFEHSHISWIKNLPLSMATRNLRFIIVFTIFLLPESVVLVKYFPAQLHWSWIVLNFFYLLSIVYFFFGFLHVRAAPLENITRRSFWIFIFLILIILFRVPLIILICLNFAAGYSLLSRNYYLFEPYRGRKFGS